MIRNVDDLIDALGGDTEVGRTYRLSQSAVANWRLRGEVPGAWHLRLFVRLRRMGLDFDPAVFGLSGEDAKALRGFAEKPDEPSDQSPHRAPDAVNHLTQQRSKGA